jgi:hypothetical protein
MSECCLVSFMVPEGPPYYANGSEKAVTQCTTHNWTFDGVATAMCPIGRIEQATYQAIARIREVSGE